MIDMMMMMMMNDEREREGCGVILPGFVLKKCFYCSDSDRLPGGHVR